MQFLSIRKGWWKMRFLHISDLHLGIKLMDVDLIEDQRFILDSIVTIANEKKVDAILIAGDVYDSTMPRIEAITLLDDFLTKLCENNIKVFMISGNHDQVERLSFGSKIFKNSNIYISERYSKDQKKIVIGDEYGNINIYLLPFIKPINIKTEFDSIDENITYDKAIKIAIDNFDVNFNDRNVILAHQFIAGSSVCESENFSIGGSDQVSGSYFEKFDYAALGHLHTPQMISKNEHIRYSGSPLKLSFSEVNVDKVAVLVDIKEKGNVIIESIKLMPLHDMAVIKGKYKELIEDGDKIEQYKDTYLKVELTDEKDEPYAKDKLSYKYKKILQVVYNRKNKSSDAGNTLNDVMNKKSDIDLVKDFFKEQMGKDMDDAQISYVEEAFENLEESK